MDVIKNWIQENTQRMLDNKEVLETVHRLQKEREEIEEEMLQLDERLSAHMLQKERKNLEKLNEEDEGRKFELEDELDTIQSEILVITEMLDSLDTTLSYINRKISSNAEKLAQAELDSVNSLSFAGLRSVDTAKATLKTFFNVVLELNIYKRDLEEKVRRLRRGRCRIIIKDQ